MPRSHSPGSWTRFGLSPRAWPAGWEIDEARSWWSRTRGLLGTAELGVRAGLWLPVRSVHTWGMRYPLDLVWLAADGRVIRIDEAVRGLSLRSCRRATGGVVETAVGVGPVLAAELETTAGGGGGLRQDGGVRPAGFSGFSGPRGTRGRELLVAVRLVAIRPGAATGPPRVEARVAAAPQRSSGS